MYKADLSPLCLWPTMSPFQVLQGYERGFPLNNTQESLSHICFCTVEGYQDKISCLHHQKMLSPCCCPSVLHGEGILPRILSQSLAWVLCYLNHSSLSSNMGSVPIPSISCQVIWEVSLLILLIPSKTNPIISVFGS